MGGCRLDISQKDLTDASSELTAGPARVLRGIYQVTAKYGKEGWISNTEIAEEICVDRKTVERNMPYLVDNNFVKKKLLWADNETHQHLGLNVPVIRRAASKARAKRPKAKRDGRKDIEGTRNGSTVEPRDRVTTQPGETMTDMLIRIFGYPKFRGDQEQTCQAVVDGKDVLVVMPTAAGKSLCFQLPAIALGGTALVVSPLVALMCEQAEKLTNLGIIAECIYSGNDDAETWRRYLRGELQFLFVAPERLADLGFQRMLIGHKPSLLIVDEAHCISTWGRDFRPEYRQCGQVFKMLRPAPIIALTATATPQVQADIVTQLGLLDPRYFIQSARRTNIAIDTIKVPKAERNGRLCALLQESASRPAIVYASTIKETETLARELKKQFSAEAYHSKLDPKEKIRVQKGFLAGEIEVVVSTIAFGMGIDKPDIRMVIHTYLPASVHDYYQQIGRAGRDGKASRAVLMYSYDQYQQNLGFWKSSGEELSAMETIYSILGSEPKTKFALQISSGLDPTAFDKAIGMLRAFNGVEVDCNDDVKGASDGWRAQYNECREQKREEIDEMFRFAEGDGCRMAAMVTHFDCPADTPAGCGICDNCLRLEDSMKRMYLADSANCERPDNPYQVGQISPAGCGEEEYPHIVAA